jgi:hypothetical protein
VRGGQLRYQPALRVTYQKRWGIQRMHERHQVVFARSRSGDHAGVQVATRQRAREFTVDGSCLKALESAA